MSTSEAYAAVLRRSGAFPRDTVTRRTIEEVRTRCGAWGAKPPRDLLEGLAPTSGPEDTDRDGIPDAWERSRGRSSTNPDDARQPLEGEYTALEVYVNELADALVRDAPAQAPDAEGPCPDAAPSFGEGARDAGGCACDGPGRGVGEPPWVGLACALGLLGRLASRRSAR